MADYTCRICGKVNCDDDCEELALIYREAQREKLRDIDLDEIEDEPSFWEDYSIDEDYDNAEG